MGTELARPRANQRVGFVKKGSFGLAPWRWVRLWKEGVGLDGQELGAVMGKKILWRGKQEGFLLWCDQREQKRVRGVKYARFPQRKLGEGKATPHRRGGVHSQDDLKQQASGRMATEKWRTVVRLKLWRSGRKIFAPPAQDESPWFRR